MDRSTKFAVFLLAVVNSDGTPEQTDYLDTWKGMEESKKLGVAKSIGVSNFNAAIHPSKLSHLRVASAVEVPTKELNDGNRIPCLALGTYGSDKDIAKMRDTINWAVEAGYRHIDTAAFYANEEEIGQGIGDVIGKGIVTRKDLFVTTKLWSDKHGRDQVVPALRESLRKLGLEYVDLYLIHFPIALKEDGSLADTDYLETWKGMEEAKKLGLAKSIGVSNFNSEQIDRVIANCVVKPAVNEIEVNPTLTQEKLVSHCQNLGIRVMGYSPFGFLVSRDKDSPAPPPQSDDPTLVKIANKYGKSTSQVVLRYLIDRDIIPIPKSTNKNRLEQNVNVFDFNLTTDEIDTINKFNKNIRVVDIPSFKDHPYYPFNKD